MYGQIPKYWNERLLAQPNFLPYRTKTSSVDCRIQTTYLQYRCPLMPATRCPNSLQGHSCQTKSVMYYCLWFSSYFCIKPRGLLYSGSKVSSTNLWLNTSTNGFKHVYKPIGNLLENIFCRKCTFKNDLQLLQYNILSQTNTML